MKIIKTILVPLVLAMTLLSCEDKMEKADLLSLDNNFIEAFDIYKKAAERGNVYATYRLARAYAYGLGTEIDEQRAMELFREAADKGSEEAKCDLALAVIGGLHGQEKDYVSGFDSLKALGEQSKNAYVRSRYAGVYFWGLDTIVSQDKDKAYEILQTVDDKDNYVYLYQMAQLYLHGSSAVAVNESKAIELFSQAYDNGSKYSAYCLGDIYQYGLADTKVNLPAAVKWFGKGVEGCDQDCMLSLAAIHLSDNEEYAKQHNVQKGLQLLERAALLHNAEAYSRLGVTYITGKGVTKDDEKGYQYLLKAAEYGSASGKAVLGHILMSGIGCKADKKEGVRYLEEAAEAGQGAASYELYSYYLGTDNRPISLEKAMKYLEMAGKEGNEAAYYSLGYYYYTGNQYIKKNYEQARIYMEKAAELGVVDAYTFLSEFYRNGIGGPKDLEKAEEYLMKSVGINTEEFTE